MLADVVELASVRQLFAGHGVGDSVEAFLELVAASGIGRDIEGRWATADAYSGARIGDYLAGEVTRSGKRHIARRAAASLFRQNQVRDLRLARIVGSIKVAGPNLDAFDPACGNAAEEGVERFGLGAWPLSVGDNVTGGPGEPADIVAVLIAAEIEREPGDTLDDVVRRPRRIF